MKVNKKILYFVFVGILVIGCFASVKYDEFNKERDNAIKYVESDIGSEQRTYEHMQEEGYDSDLIQYAMENANIDWNKNALRCAKDLIEMGIAENEEELSQRLLDSAFKEKEIQYAIDNLTKKDWEKGNEKYQDKLDTEYDNEYQENTVESQEIEESEMTTEEKLETVADISGLKKGTDYKIESDSNTIFFLLYAQNNVDESMKNKARELSIKFKSLVEDDTKIIVSYVDSQRIIYSAYDGKDL